ncbi:MAG: glycosyl hydrolase [Opitutaceae bacterium]|jgi:hypothetical protein
MITPPRSLLALGLLLSAATALADVGSLESSFRTPPDDSRIMMRWWWFGPAVTKTEIAREIRTMKAGGIGGFEVQPVYPLAIDGQIPGLKNVPFLSPEFLDMLGFTAAEAKAQGMRMDLTLGSGWPYGGPMFSVGESPGALRIFNAVAAFGQPSVPLPALLPGEKLMAAFMGPAPGADALTDTYRDFYQQMEIRDQMAWLPNPVKGPAPVVFFISSHTGMKVKRAAVGAEGFAIDHYDSTAVQRFISEIAGPELAACGPNTPTSVFCDSLEVFNTDWTPNLLDEFKRRRGYDLTPNLPALISDFGAKAADIRHDWARTLTEVFTDNFVARIQAWAAAHGTQFRIQAYGTPPAAEFTYAAAGLPEGEGMGWKGMGPMRWASSASHLLGRTIASSETWTWLHRPVFRATPLDMKAAADEYFLQGSNQLVGHGWPYTAEGVGYPGWRFYASAVFDEKNPWWIVMPDVTSYLQRTSFLLRQGAPANDVALYLANDDAWAKFQPGEVAMSSTVFGCLGPDITREILDSGHNFDGFDDEMLALRGKVDGGALEFGDLRYRVVVLAGVERMPLATLRALEAFARGGGTLIATRRLPEIVPGFNSTVAEQSELRGIVHRLFLAPDAPGIFLPDESGFAAALDRRLAPDAGFTPASPDLGVVHRHTADAEIYFLANTGAQPVSSEGTFRVAGSDPEWWNLMNGQVEPAAIVRRSEQSTTVGIKLPAFGSRALVFSTRHLPASPPLAYAGPAPAPLDLSTGWIVNFGLDSKPVMMDRLQSWTENEATRSFSGVATYAKSFDVPEEMVKAGLGLTLTFGEPRSSFGGPRGGRRETGTGASAPAARGRGGRGGRGGASYESFEAPVREAAVVYVNGKRAGSVWCPPYALDVTGYLNAGHNEIRVEVANLALNYMAAHPLPDYQALNARYGERFLFQEPGMIQAQPSGLLGPIRLVAGR